MPDSPSSPPVPAAVAASRRWSRSRRRLTLFVPYELCEGIEGAELRVIAYKAVYEYLANLEAEQPHAP